MKSTQAMLESFPLRIDVLGVLGEFYRPETPLYEVLLTHSALVTRRALEIASRLGALQPDIVFIAEAGMLHDIGICKVRAEAIGCFGDRPYVCHGYLGREMLEGVGLPRHAVVCETHVGTGISAQEIRRGNLPLPQRDMLPSSLEEEIICFADKFYTKDPGNLWREYRPEEICHHLARYGADKVAKFRAWEKRFAP